jgi:ParB family chromosome partitioning protein
VRTPISVRPHPDTPGRWVLNFGARRLRASKLAGKAEIPAFVDRAADAYDQMIENEQREGLTPLELALFVQRRLAAGESQAEIARRIGKSKMYVTYATALIDAPDWLLDLYRQGRCRGLRELHELRRLHADGGHAVRDWAAGRASITRTGIDELRELLSVAIASKTDLSAPRQGRADQTPSSNALRAIKQRNGVERVSRTDTRQLCAYLDGVTVAILAHAIPPKAGHVFVVPAGCNDRVCVAAARLTLLGFIDVATE